jgi:hypothetical protein
MNPTQTTLSVEQFRSRFFLEESPHWTVHNATRSSELMGRYRPDKEFARTPEEIMIYSWMQLEEFFSTFSAGMGKVILRRNPSDNKINSPTMYVRWGTQMGGAAGAGIGNTSMGMNNDQPSWAMMFQLQEKNHEKHLDMVKTMIELRHEKEQMEAEIEGMGAPSLQQTLITKGIDVASAFLMGGMAPAPQGQLGTLGEGPAPDPAPQETVEVPPLQRPISHDQLSAAAELIRANVNYHPNDVISAIALLCQQKPTEAAGYIGMLISQVKQAQHVG